MRLDELNTMRLCTVLLLFSMRSYWQKHLGDLGSRGRGGYPSPPRSVRGLSSAIFRGFYFLGTRVPEMKNQKNDPPAFFVFFHLGPFVTSCNAPFSPEKGTRGHFLGFLFFSPRPARAVFEHPHEVFLWITYKRRTLSYIFSAHVVKISDPCHARSGHQGPILPMP